jgi:HSP20 family molecular chaperone IbpA
MFNPLNPFQAVQDMRNFGEKSMSQFQRDIGDLFQRYFGDQRGSTMTGGMTGGAFDSPHFWDFRVEERESEVYVRAELPGFDEQDIQVELCDDQLRIRAEKKHREGNGQENYKRFRRDVTLPRNTLADGIQANYRSGVLEVRVPRSEEKKGKQIPVNAN